MEVLSNRGGIYTMCVGALALLAATGCGRGANDSRSPEGRASPAAASIAFAPRAIGIVSDAPPWITHLEIVDLDRDGALDILVCDGRLNQISWLRRLPSGDFEERALGQPVSGPAHVTAADLDRDGDLDLLVASMGIILPSNEKTGAVVVLENDGAGGFTNRVLLDKTHRVTDVRAADLDGDGDLDLAVGQFGYLDGQVQWLENLGEWRFRGHQLLPLAGTVHAPIADLNQDGRPDIVALVTQDWEEVHAFDNQGGGVFKNRVLYGSTNKDFGSSGLRVVDLDGDGDVDLLYANGDGFDYATPGSRPWHGVQWLENNGRGEFAFRRIGSLPGAYSPLAIDLDGDGDRDVVAVSGFNDWSNVHAVSLAWFENNGRQGFTRHDLARQPTHLVVVVGADLDYDGQVELVTGGFCFYPPYDRAARLTLWERTK
ncbi:MAG TPA: VCBS repeat-containing protein [Candidatus Synoicihabitans sp.]|nr:VCBS repeat-containing protein [Candidatus Synoicihabitans sp.]